jgi:hypothetical protein
LPAPERTAGFGRYERHSRAMKIAATFTVIAATALASAASAASPALTLASSAPTVAYGKSVTLSGMLTPAKANQQITITALACGTTKTANVARVKTTATGSYSASVTPTVGTSYQATQKALKSAPVMVNVKPVIVIKRVKRGSFTASVTAGMDLKGKPLLFQRYATVRKRWVQVKKVTLTTSVPGPAKPTVIASAPFKAKVARRARVRLVISKAQAAPCYVTAKSNVVRN